MPSSTLVKDTGFGRIIVPFDWIGHNIYLDNYEQAEINIYRQLLARDSTVIDVGANIGFSTLLFSDICRNGFVYSFEPSVREYVLLSRNVELNERKNVSVIRQALGSSRMDEILYTHDQNSGMNSIVHADHALASEKIHVDSLDNFVTAQAIPRIDLIKIDVEGYELQVLKGAARVIDQHKPLVCFESWASHQKPYDEHATGELALLTDAEYEIFQFREARLMKLVQGDVVQSVNLMAIHKRRSRLKISEI
jgi:FkbM family methyltransferase